MLIKNGFKTCFFFVKKLKISCSLDHTILFQFYEHVVQTFFLRNVWRDFRLSMSALATVTRKSSNSKFTVKIDFPIGHFMLPLLMLILEDQSFSIHYLIGVWTTCWWNLNQVVWSKLYKILSFLTKMVNHFWRSVDAIVEDVSVTETIVWC